MHTPLTNHERIEAGLRILRHATEQTDPLVVMAHLKAGIQMIDGYRRPGETRKGERPAITSGMSAGTRHARQLRKQARLAHNMEFHPNLLARL